MVTKRTLAFLFVLSISIQLHAQASLYVQDPQATWYSSKGTIEEAVFSVGSKGIYSQVSAYLTFSARGGNFLSGSMLETVMTFTLPEGGFVTDLWLWLDNGKISKGKILDVWSASSIYEGIVNRRKDPAILKKTGARTYELRVYPMDRSATRKVRITYMTPVNWTEGSVSTPVPIEWLSASLNRPANVELISWRTTEWDNPSVSNITAPYVYRTDTFFGDHIKFDLNGYSSSSSYNLVFNNPMIKGVYLKFYKTNTDEGYYQLSLLPGNSLSTTPKKVLFLIDYDSQKSTTTRQQVLDAIKSSLINFSGSVDKFNVFYSSLNIGKASTSWINADKTLINTTIGSISESSIATYSNLPSLLKEGYDFVIKNGDGLVCLVSNSDQLGNNTSGNQVIADLQKIMTTNVPTYILDYNDRNYIYYYFNNRSYVGNEYFYDNITKLTGGVYQKLSGSVAASMNDLYQKIGGTINAFDLYTTLQDGFCYARQNMGTIGSSVTLKKPITQVGKFLGKFPFIVKTSGTYNSAPFNQTMVVTDGNDKLGEDVIQKMWANSYINSLLSGSITNSTINEIMNLSISSKVLTTYTAFLALEDTTSYCKDCYKDDGRTAGQTGIEDMEEIPTEFSLSAYPNPFNPQVTITIKLSANMIGKNLSFKIYNLLGQIVKTFNFDDFQGKNIIRLIWNGKGDDGQPVSSGIYFFNVSGAGINKSLKLMYMK
jgi:hypothetical protein